MSDVAVRWVTAALFTALALYCIPRLELDNSITHFIPSKSEAELVELSLELVDSPLARRMMLSVGGGEARDRVAAELAQALRGHPEIAWVESGLDEGELRGLYELYFARRNYLASAAPEREIPAWTTPEALQALGREQRQRLARPDAMLTARSLPADPLGFFDRIVERIRETRPPLPAAGDAWASVLLGLTSSPFDSLAQTGLLQFIDDAFARSAARHGGGYLLEIGGVNRIAVASERTIRGDVNFISALSISAVSVLFLLFFRSLRHLAIAISTPIAAFAVALAAAVSTSGPVHGITLGFGFVLLGVAIDYPIHLMNHHALAERGSAPRASLAKIRPSLLLSGVTTTLAFVALALSDFPGLAEMGRFAAIGVPVAVAFTLFATPAFLPPRHAASAVQRAVSRGAQSLVGWLSARPGVALAVVALFVVLAAAGLPRLRWEDDPASLMAVDPTLLAESERVRTRVAAFDGGRFVVGLAPDAESALILNEEIHRRLKSVVDDGELAGLFSLHAFLWPESLQRRNLAALQVDVGLVARIDDGFAQSGFRAGSFAPFAADLAEPQVPPLLPRDLVDSPLARVLDALVELDGRYAVVTYLQDVRSGAAIAGALADLETAHYVDQREIVAEIYTGFRKSTIRMLGVGSLVVLGVLLVRYRSLRRGGLAYLPSALTALTTFGLFGLLGVEVNVVSAVSLLVVLGMGADYGIFTVDAALQPERLAATLSSLLLSCLTSVFVFGVLSLSEQPALLAIGRTVGTGILLALCLVPPVFALARREVAR